MLVTSSDANPLGLTLGQADMVYPYNSLHHGSQVRLTLNENISENMAELWRGTPKWVQGE
jgi:hypothetical protein